MVDTAAPVLVDIDGAVATITLNRPERLNAITTPLLFFSLELNRLDEADLVEKLKAPALAHYAPWLRDVRAFRPHQLSDEVEKLLHEKQVAGRGAWTRLFDETIAAVRFPWDGQQLTEAEILHRLSDHDGAVRQRAAQVHHFSIDFGSNAGFREAGADAFGDVERSGAAGIFLD